MNIMGFPERSSLASHDVIAKLRREVSALKQAPKDLTPFTLIFASPLSQEEFDSWVEVAFKEDGPFGLWGEPLERGPGAVQVYGTDLQAKERKPINIGMTRQRLVAVMPQGADMDVFRRLADNVRRLVCADFTMWFGAQEMFEAEKEREGGDSE